MIFKIEYIGPQTIENAPFTIDRPDGSIDIFSSILFPQ